MKQMNISQDLNLPLEFVTQTQAILARKRVGKSYTASVQAEELLKAGQQVVVIDITGAWWGLRSSADGKGPGYPILIAGGDHGDIPLEPTAGEVMADAVVSERFSCILDLSLMRKGEMTRFLIAFLETLYRQNRIAMHLFCDEADAYAPQKPFGDEARVLGAMNDIVRRGGIRGIGCTLITQRPSILNKDVLTQCGILTCLRMSHPKDLAPIREWVDVHADPVQSKDMIKSLPVLPIGTAWMWAPGWLAEGDLFQKVQIRRRETFDSGATPKAGEAKQAPKVVADVNIKALGTKIAETAEKLKENDPKVLKTRILELERQLHEAIQQPFDETKVKEIINREIDRVCEEHFIHLEGLYSTLLVIGSHADQVQHDLARLIDTLHKETRSDARKGSCQITVTVPAKKMLEYSPRDVKTTVSAQSLPAGERAVLIAVAGYQLAGVERNSLSVLTGYKRSSRDAYIQRLKEKGFVDSQGAFVYATDPGIKALGSDYKPLPRGKELQRYWLERLPEGEKKILALLVRSGKPLDWPRINIDDETGYKRSSRDAYLQRLSARKLVRFTGAGFVRASEDLF